MSWIARKLMELILAILMFSFIIVCGTFFLIEMAMCVMFCLAIVPIIIIFGLTVWLLGDL